MITAFQAVWEGEAFHSPLLPRAMLCERVSFREVDLGSHQGMQATLGIMCLLSSRHPGGHFHLHYLMNPHNIPTRCHDRPYF